MSEENFLFDDNGFVFVAEDGSTFDFSTEQVERLIVAIQNLENPHLLEKRIHGTPIWTPSVVETFEDQIGSILDDFPIFNPTTSIEVRGFVDAGGSADNAHLNGTYVKQDLLGSTPYSQIDGFQRGIVSILDEAAGDESDPTIINYRWEFGADNDNNPGFNDIQSNTLNRSDSNPRIFQPYELNWEIGASTITIREIKTINSQHYHVISRAVKELNKKLYQFGLNSRVKGATDSGFYPDDVTNFIKNVGSIGTIDFLETEDGNLLLLENGMDIELEQDD